jgi:cyclic di-GMP phosphodiesterase
LDDLHIRVLLVEDSIDDVAIVRRMLAKYPRAAFQIDDVGLAGACVLWLGTNACDLILVDHGLPDMTGLELLRVLRDRTGSPPAIMLTGQGDERIATEAMNCGAYDYLPKDSISSDMLGHAIHQAFEKSRIEQELREEQLEGSDRVIFALASAAEAKDPMTERHLHRMATYTGRLGTALGLDERQLLLLRYGALLHDIGKIGVSETILSKRGPLTAEEWLEMRQHPVIGERICAPLKLADALCPIVRHHHERWDGGGYVDGLSGTDIPLLARVVGVVDAFDAMSSDRPYRPALPFSEIVKRLGEGAGTQWDPDLVAVLIELLERQGHQFVIVTQRREAA